ncbi:MAG: RluA family pseudouridine synthase [Desulfobacterales bacterium]|jgi:tRNA pseudouridine32 synthase/23S rRNA pseudouridine746 synthase
MQKLSLTKTVGPNDPPKASDFLVACTSLSKSRIKDAMIKGAVWLKRQKSKQQRLRRATAGLKPGDVLSIYYNKALLSIAPPRAELFSDQRRYSVWFKPAGLMSQGTKYGDHCSLLRQVELFYKSKRNAYLIQRLDREASGLVLLAHDRLAAGRLSRLFQTRQVIKKYSARVQGKLFETRRQGKVDLALEGKAAETEFVADSFDPVTHSSTVQIVIRTGRKHQIRRHFDLIGHPLIGDPRYGKGNKNREGLQLVATALEFECPFKKKRLLFEYAAR